MTLQYEEHLYQVWISHVYFKTAEQNVGKHDHSKPRSLVCLPVHAHGLLVKGIGYCWTGG